MPTDAYEPPSSNLEANPSNNDDLHKRNRKRMMLAFWVTPICTTSIVMGIAIFIDGVWDANYKLIGKLFFQFLVVTYLFAYFFFTPLHWYLEKQGKHKLYIYLLAGLIVPTPLVWLSGEYKSVLTWLLTSGIGGIWAVIFWFIAIYLSEKHAS